MRHAYPVLLLAVLAALAILPAPPAHALPNLKPQLIAGWDFEVVPRRDNDATLDEVAMTDDLLGWTAWTWWNSAIINWSADPMPEGFVWRVYVDDDDHHLGYSYTTAALPAWSGVHSLNKGPVDVNGGRHTFELRIDEDDYIAESDETDNNLAYQFVWSPLLISEDLGSNQEWPPHQAGGWDAVPAGEVRWYNADGFRFISSGWWNAVVLTATDDTDDYDCRLHAASTGCRDGFAANIGYSSRPAGYTDAVIVNKNTMGQTSWDVGVLNQNDGDGWYLVEQVTSTEIVYGYPRATTIPSNEAVQLWEFLLTSTYSGWTMFELETDDPVDGLWLDYYGSAFGTGALDDLDGSLCTTDGFCRGFMEITDTGYHCVAIVRDPILDAGDIDYTLTVTVGRPDFTPNTPAGWHSPCVPRSDTAGTPASVALPDTLHGNAATYPNVAMWNASPVPYLEASPYLKLSWEYDEQPLSWIGFNPIDSWDTIEWNGTTPAVIPGGRHTYTLRLDRDEDIAELDETNNVYGEQYCWSPYPLATGTVTMRTMPAFVTAGWSTIDSGETAWFNSDGLRLPAGTGYWKAMAVLPVDADADIDVRLHETLTGVKDGFAGNLAASDFAAGASDYVLVNFNRTGQRAFDAGVVTFDGTGTYRAHAAREEFVATYPDGTYGPYTMSSLALLRLYEVYLAAGDYLIRLDLQDGDADLGLTLHPGASAFQWKGQCVSGGLADEGGPGENERIVVTIPSSDYFCLGVWKSGSADLNRTATYTLKFLRDFSPAPDGGDLPAATGLTGVYPNPCNPRATVEFALAAPADVELAVYDLTGRRVATLARKTYTAGVHRETWRGRDDAGRPAASGAYLVRLQAGEVDELRKVTLIK